MDSLLTSDCITRLVFAHYDNDNFSYFGEVGLGMEVCVLEFF